MTERVTRLRRHSISGALAGAATVVLFTTVHHVMISDIWFSLLPMLVVGALCGMALAGSYRVVFEGPAVATWVAYNGAYLALLVLMGVFSVAIFEPITTSAAIMDAGGPPPPELFAQALPFTALFTIAAAGAISLAWARSLPKAAAVLGTTVILVFLFGLNISVVGLVEMSGEGHRALIEFLGLTVLILTGNAGFFLAIERRAFFARGEAADPAVAAKPQATEEVDVVVENI